MKRAVDIFNKLSLRMRLMIASVLCILLPSIFSIILTNNQMKEEQIAETITQTENSLQVLDRNITEYFDDLLYLSNYLQFDNEISTILKQNLKRSKEGRSTTELDALDHITITHNLSAVSRLLKPSYVTILLENEFIYTNYSSYNISRFTNEDWYKEILNLRSFNTYWLGVHPTYIESETEDSPHLISITRKLPLTESTKAYVLISVDGKEINSLFEQSAIDKKQQLMLIDSSGTVLSHNNEKQVQKQFPFMDQLNDKAHYNIVELNNRNYLLVSYPLAYADWMLVSMVPYESAIGSIDRITNSTLLLQISFFIIFLILLILFVKKLTAPVSKLSFVMNQVEKGNLKERSGITGKGDIEKLGNSLDIMIDKIEEMIEQIKKEESSKRKAELEMLQAQINPHFLFNILNSIRLKILLKGDEESSELLQSLSQLLRMTINRNNEYISLDKEIETIEHYIKLMNFRGRYHIEMIKDLEPDILLEEVPRFFLQPIIENSIIHGYEQNGGVIRISVWKEESYLMVKVLDYGKGIEKKNLEMLERSLSSTNFTSDNRNKNKSSFTGIGLMNVYQRMFFIYGEKFQMKVENHELGGTQVTFLIPREQEEVENV